MKNDLIYQSSEYDCGPVSLINAIRVLYDREEIPPDLLKFIFLYTLDTLNDQGEYGKLGTSRNAMRFFSAWLNQYGQGKRFPIFSRYISGLEVSVTGENEIQSCLASGGVTIIRCCLGGDEHFVLLTELRQSGIALFDPYWVNPSYFLSGEDHHGIEIIEDEPRICNRVVPFEILENERWIDYAMGPGEKREAIMVSRSIFWE